MLAVSWLKISLKKHLFWFCFPVDKIIKCLFPSKRCWQANFATPGQRQDILLNLFFKVSYKAAECGFITMLEPRCKSDVRTRCGEKRGASWLVTLSQKSARRSFVPLLSHPRTQSVSKRGTKRANLSLKKANKGGRDDAARVVIDVRAAWKQARHLRPFSFPLPALTDCHEHRWGEYQPLFSLAPLHSFEQYVILSELEISELSMMGLKMTSNGLFISVTRLVQNMLRYERSGKSRADPKYD